MGEVALHAQSTVPHLRESAELGFVESACGAELLLRVGIFTVSVVAFTGLNQCFAQLCASKIRLRFHLVLGMGKNALSAPRANSHNVELAELGL
jgi:hypothetical protein